MKLQAKETNQKEKIKDIFGAGVLEVTDDGVIFDEFGEVTFEQMAEVIDFLRSSDKKDELFDECWKAYRRKGSKKKSKEYWNKLKDKEKGSVLNHINAYVSTRDIQFQKDFERYLRDKNFNDVVYSNNVIVYDPIASVEKEKKEKEGELVINGQMYR